MSYSKVLLAFTLAFVPAHSRVEAKCFPAKIEEVIEQRFQWVAVRKHSKTSNGRCEATVEILRKGKALAASTGFMLDGWSNDIEICKGKIGTQMGIFVDAFCCDEAPCPKVRKNEIQFSLIRLEKERTSKTGN